jgi:hypothetical protein
MTLADLFMALNAANIRPANLGGQLELRGPANAITVDIRTAAAEHKTALLAMLPPQDRVEQTRDREAIPVKGNGQITPCEVAQACQEWELIISDDLLRMVEAGNSPWEPDIAQKLVTEVSLSRSILPVGWHQNEDLFRRFIDMETAIDAAWLAQDLGGLKRAVGGWYAVAKRMRDTAAPALSVPVKAA